MVFTIFHDERLNVPHRAFRVQFWLTTILMNKHAIAPFCKETSGFTIAHIKSFLKHQAAEVLDAGMGLSAHEDVFTFAHYHQAWDWAGGG